MADTLLDIPLGEIWADADFNSRQDFSPASVSTLADSIQQQGLIEPILVQPCVNKAGKKWKVVVGHRRYMAHQLLLRGDQKYATIKAVAMDRVLSDEEALVLNLKENMEREPLNMLQEARAIRRFEKMGWDEKRIAKSLGQTKKWVEVRLGLLTLPEVIQRRAEANYLTQYQLDEILQLPSPDEQYEYVRAIVDRKEGLESLTGDEVKKAAKRGKKAIDVAAQGVVRTAAEMILVAESIQDSFQDNKHPAAAALIWAAGMISYDDLVERANQWAEAAGVEYKEHEDILKSKD